ncbi:MAG: geranylgeranylglycerol-phosphate geranylgeranyltransferase [Candidatus Bathyarchaeota archaeon]|nr:geranylgeranylglycerol-phosphate geranylgeranyltransferase [Candidatus Bathyarchaeota archaeon]
MRRIYGCIRLIRPINCLMTGLAVYVGLCIALRRMPEYTYINHTILSYITGFTLCGASMAINDYFDLPIDRINAPYRPIPSGEVSPRLALTLSIAMSAAGLISAIFVSPICLLYAMFFVTLSYLYSWRIKRLGFPGNIVVSLCVSAPFIYGGLAALSITDVGGGFLLLLLFSSIAFLANLGREVTKGIADVEGDRLHDVKSLAVRYGVKRASIVASIFYLSAVALSLIPPIRGIVSLYYYPFIIFVDLGFIYSTVKLSRNLSRDTALRIKNMALFLMLLGLIGFMLGGLA